jgi:hypothetical protein
MSEFGFGPLNEMEYKYCMDSYLSVGGRDKGNLIEILKRYKCHTLNT